MTRMRGWLACLIVGSSAVAGCTSDASSDVGVSEHAESSAGDGLRCVAPGGCPVYFGHDISKGGPPNLLGHVGEGTVMGVFTRSGTRHVVSYPMEDRGWSVQFVDTTGGAWAATANPIADPEARRAAEPLEGHNEEGLVCTSKDGCAVYSTRDLATAPTSLGTVPCGTKMGVFVADTSATVQRYVVSYPMEDRNGAVQVVTARAISGRTDAWTRVLRGDGTYGSFDPAPYCGEPAPAPRCASCGINVGQGNGAFAAQPEEIRKVGGGWVRLEIADECAVDREPARLAVYDDWIRRARAAGLEVLLILDYMTVKGAPFQNRTDAPWISFGTTFSRCAASIAKHFASPPFRADTVGAYEIWNEEDNPPGNPAYDPYVPPGAYAQMFNGAADAIRAAVRSAAGAQAALPKIITGGLDGGVRSGYLQALVATPGGLRADGIGIHAYGSRPDPNWPRPDWGYAYLKDSLDTYHSFAPDLPIWLTEFGVESGKGQDTPKVQADLVTRTYARLAQDFASTVAHAFVFSYADSTAGTWGLVDGTGIRKASYDAFFRMAVEASARP